MLRFIQNLRERNRAGAFPAQDPNQWSGAPTAPTAPPWPAGGFPERTQANPLPHWLQNSMPPSPHGAVRPPPVEIPGFGPIWSQPSGRQACAPGPCAPPPANPADTANAAFGEDHRSVLLALKEFLRPENQGAVDNLLRYYANAAARPVNRQLLAPYAVPHAPDDHTLIGLHRPASFLLIKDVLESTERLVANHEQVFAHPQADEAERVLLTSQLMAIRTQARNLREAEIGKLVNGQLAVPMVLQKPRFKQFLRTHRPTIELLIGSCQRDGQERKDYLGHYLTELAHHYLAATDRLPKGLEPNVRFQASPEVVFTEGQVNVHVDEEANLVMPVLFPPEFMGVVVLNNSDCPHSWSDPEDPSNRMAWTAAPFAHCRLPVKQAAALLVKFLADLTHLEMKSAQFKKERSIRPGSAPLTATMHLDYLYRGSSELGDRHGHDLPEFFDQRLPVAEGILPLSTQAQAYAQTHGAPLICEPDLAHWVGSPEFGKDLHQIRLPTARLRMLAIHAATEALLEDPLFQPPRR